MRLGRLEKLKLTDSIDLQLSPGEVRVELVEISHHGEFVGHREETHVGRLDDPWNSDLLASLKSLFAVPDDVRWNHRA